MVLMIIRIGICDDNSDDLKKIEKMIQRYMNKIATSYVIKNFVSGEELLKNLEVFDLLFLDISMGGINGIQTGNEIRKASRQTRIIYTTSYHEYMEQAVNQVHAFSYMVKPVSEESFKAQMDDAMIYIQEEKQKLETIFFDIIEVTKDGKVEYVSKEFAIEDIYYFEYMNRKVMIKLKGEEFFFNTSMKDLVEKMKKYYFEQCHQNFMVSLKHIKRIKGYDIFLDNEDKIPVSQKKSAIIRKSLNQFVQSSI